MYTEESAIIHYAGRTYKVIYHIDKNCYWIYFQRSWMEEKKLVAKFGSLRECLHYIDNDL